MWTSVWCRLGLVLRCRQRVELVVVTVRITGVPCNNLQLADLMIGISIYIYYNYIYIHIYQYCAHIYISINYILYVSICVNVQWQILGELPDYLGGWSSFNANEGFLLCQMTIAQI